jgi:hypothetical protein
MCSLTSLFWCHHWGMPDFTQLLDAGGWRGLATSESCFDHHASRFDQSPGLSRPYFPVTTTFICFGLDVLHRTIRPCCHSQQVSMISVSVISAYITRVGPHINVVQRGLRLSIFSYPSPEQDSRPDLTSTLLLALSSHSISLLSVALSTWPQNFSLCIFSP